MTLRYRIVHGAFRALTKLLTRVDAQGLERVPMEGPLIVAVNHTSLFEGPIVLALLPRQPLSAMAKMEWKGTLIGKIIDALDPVYVVRGEVDRKALKETITRLKQGEAFGIAPEGTRSESGQLLEGKEGVAYIAMQTDAWIFPGAVWGQEKVKGLGWLRRPRVHIRFGEPFKLENDPTKDRKTNLEAGTQRIMHAIARLLPPEYRGVYADEVQDMVAT